MKWQAVPIYITVRDRLTDLQALIGWLEAAGHERIILLDNASTYEPLIEYLKACPHEVRYLGQNLGARSAWLAEQIPAGEWFVVTDPDVLPVEECPHDLVAHLHELLQRYPTVPKAGPALFLDDITDAHFLHWERSLISPDRQLELGVFASLIDTTFALHRPNTPFTYDAIRTGPPYQARHLSWYREDAPTSEDRFYLDRAIAGPDGSSWAQRAISRCH